VAFAYVILITGTHLGESSVTEAFTAGADDFLIKPINLTELDARLQPALRMCRLYRELEHRTRDACSANARLSVANEKLEAANEKLRYVAVTDELTGLPNRRHIIKRLEEAWQASSRHRTPLACTIIDVDHFKAVNDTYGHLTGDVVLREAAQSMLLAVRAGEVLGRLGGEEFLLVLPHSDMDEAATAAERLRQTIERMRVPVGDSHLSVTISLGVAERVEHMADAEALLGMADEALYAAKRAGRNTVRRRPVADESKSTV
jgi:diguanylate cyclase (GGDEF)-like protein